MKISRKRLRKIINEFLDTSRPMIDQPIPDLKDLSNTSVYDQLTNSERAAFVSAMGIAGDSGIPGTSQELNEGDVISFRQHQRALPDLDGDITPNDLRAAGLAPVHHLPPTPEEEEGQAAEPETPAEEAPAVDTKEMEEGKAFAILSYVLNFLGIPFWLVPLIMRNNSFSLYHAKQYLILWLAGAAGSRTSVMRVCSASTRRSKYSGTATSATRASTTNPSAHSPRGEGSDSRSIPAPGLRLASSLIRLDLASARRRSAPVPPGRRPSRGSRPGSEVDVELLFALVELGLEQAEAVEANR